MIDKIKNVFWSAVGILTAKDKVKLRVEFNDVVKTEREVKKLLLPFNVVKAEQKGVYTWRVDIRSNRSGPGIIDILMSRTKQIRNVEQVPPS